MPLSDRARVHLLRAYGLGMRSDRRTQQVQKWLSTLCVSVVLVLIGLIADGDLAEVLVGAGVIGAAISGGLLARDLLVSRRA